MNTLENNKLRLVLTDPELDRLYHKLALAVGVDVQIPQQPSKSEVEEEPHQDLEPWDKCLNTFGKLE